MLESLVMGVANGTLIGVINYFAEESNAWKLLTSANGALAAILSYGINFGAYHPKRHQRRGCRACGGLLEPGPFPAPYHFEKMVCAYRLHSANCCLKRRALHPNALPTWLIAAAGQLGNWANSNVKLLFIAHATVGMGLAPSVGEAALVRRIDWKNG